MNKLRIDLELDSKGYIQGAQDAIKSTKTLEQTTKQYVEDFGSLRKQMIAAKKDVQNLAGAYASLSKTEKSSALGKEMKAQLDLAIEKAAEFQDVMSDTQQAIKNASSDTATWDGLKEGMEIAKSATLAYAGAVAKLTGNEEDLARIVKTLTLVENGFNAAIKIGNALQNQSAIMSNIRKIQILAAAKAEELQTAATVKGTIAQKAFNTVAKANPYVLLATVAVAAAAAIGGYMLATSKAASEENKLQTEINKSKEAVENFSKAVGSEYGKLRGSYEQLRTAWKALKTDHEKNKFLVDNKTKIEELTSTVKDLDTAETFFNGNASKVIKSFELRARAAAAAALAVEKYGEAMKLTEESRHAVNLNGLKMTKKTYEGLSDELKKFVKLEFDSEGRQLYVFRGLTSAQDKLVQQAGLYSQKLRMQADEAERSAKSFENLYDEAEKASQAANPHNNGNGNNNNSNNNNNDRKKATKEELTRLQELENKAKDVQKQLENLDKTSPTFEVDKTKLQADLKTALQEVKDYRIAIGLDLPKSKLQELKDALKEAETELPFAVSDEDVRKIRAKINNLKDEIESEEVRLGIKVEPVSDGKDVKKAQDIVQETFNKITPPKFDFSFIPDDFKYAGQSITDIENKYSALTEARKQLTEVMNTSTDDQAIHDAQIGLKSIGDELDNLEPKLETLNKINEKFKQFQEISNAAGKAGNYLNQLGSAFTKLGESTDSAGVKAVGIILETLANLALSFSQAMIQAAAMGPWAWIAFGIAGVAQLAAMISQIKGMVSGGFAEGGVVPGSSFSGDKLLARVNSGERILTAKQNENLEKIANGVDAPIQKEDLGSVQFIIKGTSLIGTINNTLKTNRKQPIGL